MVVEFVVCTDAAVVDADCVVALETFHGVVELGAGDDTSVVSGVVDVESLPVVEADEFVVLTVLDAPVALVLPVELDRLEVGSDDVVVAKVGALPVLVWATHPKMLRNSRMRYIVPYLVRASTGVPAMARVGARSCAHRGFKKLSDVRHDVIS